MTARGYETIARSHLIPALGRHRLDRLTTRHVQRLLDDLNASGRAPGTIQNVRAALNSALELRVKWQLVSRNVAANAEVPRITRRSIEPLSLAEAHRFLEAVADHRLGPLFTVATALGLRQSEALALRWATSISTRASCTCGGARTASMASGTPDAPRPTASERSPSLPRSRPRCAGNGRQWPRSGYRARRHERTRISIPTSASSSRTPPAGRSTAPSSPAPCRS